VSADGTDDADPFASLTLKERRFVEAYMGAAAGNGTRAAEMAGYRGNAATLGQVAYTKLKKREIREAIAMLSEHDPLVAGRIERLRFFTSVMRGEVTERRVADGGVIEIAPLNARIRAAEKLSEIAGDFREPDSKADGVLPPGLTIAELFDLAGIPRARPDSPERAGATSVDGKQQPH
jgi:phage terminase small subunit